MRNTNRLISESVHRLLPACMLSSILLFGCWENVDLERDCPQGSTECNEVCVDTSTDRSHCGGCNQPCGSGDSCVAGQCVQLCGGSTPTLCGDSCVNTATDRQHCGACGNACGTGEFCHDGDCVAECPSYLSDCNDVCVNTDTDRNHCGACNNACDAGEICHEGDCVFECPSYLAECNDVCVNTDTDRNHCGACNNACDAGEICHEGDCLFECPSYLKDCNDVCVNTDTDRSHCGECDNECDPGYVCDGSGECALSCQAGLIDCNGTCIDPHTSNHYCGASGDCLGENAGEPCDPGHVCDGGICSLSCPSYLFECYGVCVDTENDPMYCGDCDISCPSGLNSTPLCIEGVCDLLCDFHWGNCDGDPLTGCDNDLLSDSDNCGMCGNKCPAAMYCSGGSCEIAESCSVILDLNPSAPSGWYMIDPDGFGPLSPMEVYCDMESHGGGWTNIDFTSNRVLLENGIFVQCQGGITYGDDWIRCDLPIFNDDPYYLLYHYMCDGSDHSADYILDHMAPLLGHQLFDDLGFDFLEQYYDWGPVSWEDNEFCYIDGQVVHWSDPLCEPYNSQGNGNCTPGYFILSR